MSIRIIGADDWLIFGRTDAGATVYTVCETWPVWLDAPHGGAAEYGTPEDAEDWAYVLTWAGAHADSLTWTPAEH